MAQDPWFDYAEALLQIAIVLTSVAILTGVHALFWVPPRNRGILALLLMGFCYGLILAQTLGKGASQTPVRAPRHSSGVFRYSSSQKIRRHFP
jgi:hypothetical protein